MKILIIDFVSAIAAILRRCSAKILSCNNSIILLFSYEEIFALPEELLRDKGRYSDSVKQIN